MIRPEFWQGKRVFLTGHTGFKGAWLALWLHRMGADVKGFALEPESNKGLFTSGKLDSIIESDIGDVRDRERVTKSLHDFYPEIVLHLAAQPLVRLSYREPVETFATNVMGTVNVLEASRAESVRAVVNVTTDKCYENREQGTSFKEDDPLGGFDPYSSSKACSEIVTAAYRRSFFAEKNVGLASGRAGNVIGGGDWSEDRLIPDCAKALLESRVIDVRNPRSVRPWQHVLEPLAGYLLLAQSAHEDPAKYADAYNFGPDESSCKPVKDLVDHLVATWPGAQPWRDASDPNQPHEAKFLMLDSTRAKERLGWQPRLQINEALDWTMEWFGAYAKDFESARTVAEKQIERYEGLLTRGI